MTRSVLVRKKDAKIFAECAKSEGVPISVKVDGKEITFYPHGQAEKKLDTKEVETL